jgi:glycosyltransferase involved in cell wall biosynthesis
MENKSGSFPKENDIEILISTMNRDSLDFLVPMFPYSHFYNFSILIINQTENGKELTSGYSNVRVINSFEKGLAKSRNLALKNAVGKILVIADDDVVYQAEFIEKIIDAYHKFPDAAVINFSVINANENLIKRYPPGFKDHLNIFDILNVSSIEMTLNKKIVDESKTRFDENFGLGAAFETGEEAVFLSDLKAKYKQLVFAPQTIVMHKGLTSSEKKNITDQYYIQFKDIKSVLKSAKNGHEKFERTQHENK